MERRNEISASASNNDLQITTSCTTAQTTSPVTDWLFLVPSPEQAKKDDEKLGNKLRTKIKRKSMFSKKGKYKC